MKTISIIIVILIFSGLVAAQTNLLVTDEKFSPSGKVEILKGDVASKKENGIINGVTYKFYYAKGMGDFVGTKGGGLSMTEYKNNWTVGCRKDPIDDRKMCFMKMHDVGVLAIGNNEFLVSIGSNNAYDSDIAIRVDDNTAFKRASKDTFAGEEAKQIIEQLKKGKRVTTRFLKNLDEYKTEDTFDLYGFNEALQYINWAYSKIK